jgi:peptide/nickel transport system substrate-binding protein
VITRLQDTEAVRVEAGEVDVMSNGDIRPEDYTAFKRAADRGTLRLIEAGIGVDPNMLWFNLAPSAAAVGKKPWLRRKEFRQAISFAVDRQAIVNTVYLGEAVPIYGPITPGNPTWYSPSSVPAYPHDVVRARQLLAAAGLADRNGDGMLEDASGAPVRFSILTQAGHTIRERTIAVVQEDLREVGVGVDTVTLDLPSIFQRFGKGDYESIYFGFQASELDPAAHSQFWLSSGTFHVWNPRQRTPGTAWERRIDELTRKQMASSDLAERQRLFTEAQRILGEELPAVYFAAPRTILAVSARVVNPQPSVLIPQLLWSADTLAVSGPRQ